MTFNALVAEPDNEVWAAIAEGIRKQRPGAAILRVKDGEQAVRFLYHRGLYTDAPETPNLVVLAEDLPTLSTESIVARLRQHPRTHAMPVIVVRRERQNHPAGAFEGERWLEVVGTENVEADVAEALQCLCEDSPSVLAATGRRSRLAGS
jgi:CheY-like chemotaxis protein